MVSQAAINVSFKTRVIEISLSGLIYFIFSIVVRVNHPLPNFAEAKKDTGM